MSLRFGQRSEPKLRIQGVGVESGQCDPPHLLQLRMRHHCANQGFAQSAAAMVRENEDVAQPREGRRVGDDTRQTHLPAVGTVNTNAK